MLLYFVLLSVITKNVLCANILFITMLPSPSHHIWNEALVGGLLKKGHNITLIGHDSAKLHSENYTVLQVKGAEKVYEEVNLTNLIFSMNNAYEDMKGLWQYTLLFAKLDLNSEMLKILLNYPKDVFDLIVFDLGAGQCFYPLIEYFGNPPVVGVSPFALPPYVLDAMGTHWYSYIPITFLPYTDQMTFFQRVENVIYYLVDYYLKWHVNMPYIYKLAQTRFGENITPFDQIERQIAILLPNYDPILDFAQALPPHIIPVGGLHIKPPAKLSDELQKILDDAAEGVIFFSFGTNIQPSWLSLEKKQIFLDTFSKLKQIVLWKYNGNDLVNVPKNVIIRNWFPQNNILGHKNVKLFITHCGSLSTQETIYHGVPVIGVPFFIDQRNNAQKVETKMLGKKLDISTLTGDVLYRTIKEVINDPIFKKNIQALSNKFRDRLESPLERAVFWIEYTLRHKDLSNLSIRARDMTVYQRQNLDIFGFLLICIVGVILLLLIICKCVVKGFVKKIPKIKQN